jgi:hypothetical protein
MNTPTIADIRVATSETEPHYFTRSALKFFGQHMSDFKVRKSPTGRIYIYAPMRVDNKIVGYSFREFVPDATRPNYGTLHIPRNVAGELQNHNTLDSILYFINCN